MKQSRRLGFVLILLALVAPPIARGDLASDIRGILTDKLIARNEVSAEIIRLGSSSSQSETIYELKATTPRIPASNLKLITTATALDRLGADFQFRTTLARRGSD